MATLRHKNRSHLYRNIHDHYLYTSNKPDSSDLHSEPWARNLKVPVRLAESSKNLLVSVSPMPLPIFPTVSRQFTWETNLNLITCWQCWVSIRSKMVISYQIKHRSVTVCESHRRRRIYFFSGVYDI